MHDLCIKQAKYIKLPRKWRSWGSLSWELAKQDGQGPRRSIWQLERRCFTLVWQVMMYHTRRAWHWSCQRRLERVWKSGSQSLSGLSLPGFSRSMWFKIRIFNSNVKSVLLRLGDWRRRSSPNFRLLPTADSNTSRECRARKIFRMRSCGSAHSKKGLKSSSGEENGDGSATL